MHTIHRFLSLCVLSGYVIAVQDISPLIDCLTACVNETCQEACNDYINEIDLYSQVDEDTTANTSLHCTSENLMMIAFNPGMYIIEQNVSEYAWISAKATKASLATFTNLTAGTVYRFRFYKITKDGILHPETSSLFSTYKANYVPLSVQSVSLLKLEVDEENECNLRAEVDFEPAEDRSCNYNVLIWHGEHELVQFSLRMSHFQFEIKELMFDQNNTVSIFSVNNDRTKTSPQISINIYTPTCLEYYNNLTICAPEKVEGLQVTHIYNGQLYDLYVSWNKPVHEPSNYIVQIDLEKDHDPLVNYISGDKIETTFLNLKLESQYEVSIVADSLGGTSLSTSIIKNLIVEHANINKFNSEYIIGINISIIIVILVAVIYFQYYKQRNKHFGVECAHFETLDPMDSLIETTAKLPFKDYKTEMNNISLIHDKFELSPKLLKLEGVLGSGAYGIVRLGSLEDEYGNVTEVAVKMPKENPSAEDIQNLRKEILIMKYAGQHPNIVSLIGCCVLYNEPVLVVEYCSKGDLQTYLRRIWQNMVNIAFNHKVRFIYEADTVTNNGIQYLSHTFGGKEQSDQIIHIITNRLYDIQQDVAQCTEIVTAIDLLNYIRQIATGMEFLSSSRIIHRDLAARNILICADGIVKISDFGLSRDVYQENMYRKEGNGKLPLKWMAIEALTHQLYTTHSDVWSFGILLWEIVTMGAVPYPGISTDAILKLLKSGYRMERPLNCGVELYDIMLSCWNIRPHSRPTFTQLKEKVDKLLSCYSETKYLNMNEILYNDQDQYRLVD